VGPGNRVLGSWNDPWSGCGRRQGRGSRVQVLGLSA
jgi:hypothetical protein